MIRSAFGHAGRLALVLVVGGVVAGSPSVAQDEGGTWEAAPKPVPLDRLLRLPSGVSYEVKTYGGLTRRDWRERFTELTRERDEAKRALSESQDALSKMASKTAAWNLGTPGTSSGSVDPDTPLSFELNQKIRRQKRELKQAEADLETLKVEANMSKVPEEWRVPFPEPDPDEDF